MKRCEQWEDSRVFESKGALRFLMDVKFVWNKARRGLTIECAKIREGVRVSNLQDLEI